MKPGWRTSEFWMNIIAFLLTTLFASNAIPNDSITMKVMVGAASLLGALGYTVSRTLVKNKTTTAEAIMSTASKSGSENPS